jgi:hypothetical protein
MVVAKPLPNSEISISSGDKARWSVVVDSIKALIDLLPPSERDRAIQEISATVRPLPPARAERVLVNILQFPVNKEWTVEELKEKIAECGIDAKPKEVYNSITYLAKKGRIRPQKKPGSPPGS